MSTELVQKALQNTRRVIGQIDDDADRVEAQVRLALSSRQRKDLHEAQAMMMQFTESESFQTVDVHKLSDQLLSLAKAVNEDAFWVFVIETLSQLNTDAATRADKLLKVIKDLHA